MIYPTPALHLVAPAAWRDLPGSVPTLRLHWLTVFGGAELETEQREILAGNTLQHGNICEPSILDESCDHSQGLS